MKVLNAFSNNLSQIILASNADVLLACHALLGKERVTTPQERLRGTRE